MLGTVEEGPRWASCKHNTIADWPMITSSILREGDMRTESEWCDVLHVATTEFLQMVDQGIFKPVRASGARKHRLDFVGMLFTRHGGFVVAPKIFRNGTASLSTVRDVVTCIQIYRRRVNRRIRAADLSEILTFKDDAAQTIDLFLALVDWTLEHGFQSHENHARTDDPTDIDWAATMTIGVPLHIGRSVVYSEMVGRRIEYELGPLAYLQSRALIDLQSQLNPVSLFWLPEHDPMVEIATSVCGDPSYRCGEFVSDLSGLSDFLNVCNRDHDRDLASILFDWMASDMRRGYGPTAYGTTSFQNVWEDMCRTATSLFGADLSHADVASQPVSKFQDTIYGSDTQKPDILRSADGTISILDAKWYNISDGDLPGTPDVVKQIMYQLSILPEYPVTQNAFVVPTRRASTELEYMGAIQMEMNGHVDERFPPVAVLGLSWDRAVAAYCGGLPKN